MSLEILEKVKNILIKIVKDEPFRTQLMSEKVEEVKKAMADGGYNFSQEEFETAAIKILELKELGHFEELSEEELVGAVGGLSSWPYSWPRKWYPYPKPYPIDPIDIGPQPMYGVVVGPPIQAMYGVVVEEELR